MTLTKAELADLLFTKVGLNKREAKDMVEAFFEEIRAERPGCKAGWVAAAKLNGCDANKASTSAFIS